MSKSVLFFFFLFFNGVSSPAAFQVPSLTSPVEDLANIISSKDERALRNLIREFQDRGKGQFQVLTVKNLDGLTIEQAAIQVTDQWKLGSQKRDDGVLFLISAEERRIRIEVGQGLEGILTDIAIKRIIEDVMIPVFRQASPSEGILVGVYQAMKTIDPEFHANQSRGNEYQEPIATQEKGREMIVFIIVFIIFLVLSRFTSGGRGIGRRGGYGGWGGGGFGGGGFGGGGGGWSGGGGGFSGGGSSGSW